MAASENKFNHANRFLCLGDAFMFASLGKVKGINVNVVYWLLSYCKEVRFEVSVFKPCIMDKHPALNGELMLRIFRCG